VAKVTGGLMDTASFEREGLIGVPVQGWGHGSFLFDELVLLAGRRFGEGEKKVVMLGAILAKNLGKSAGDRVEMLSEEFQVVGVYQSFNVFENGSAIVPLEELQRLMDRPGRVTGFQVVLQNAPDREQLRQQVRQQIEALCNEAGEPLRLSALPAREYVKSTFQIQLSRTQAWVTSLLALIIGAIGMLNTMIMSVFEQTREIGILRAIGWRRGRIMRMILGEALVLCLCGAILGTLAAVLQVRWLASLARASGYIEGHTPAEIIAAGFAIALIVGVLGGLYPAVRAARLLPTEAIRHE
jgi:putative ABC transport system permease protein